jgi:hypothetical protein
LSFVCSKADISKNGQHAPSPNGRPPLGYSAKRGPAQT